MLVSLLLPVLVASVAVFFMSFLAWMVLGLHKHDWEKMPSEDTVIGAIRESGVRIGNYMFPGCANSQEMKSEEYQRKWQEGPAGIITVFPKVSMGKNLGLTFVYFLVVNFCLAYLATLALPAGSDFKTVFRFAATAALLAYLPAIIQHAIWFHCRIVGHVVESVAYALIVGAIYAAMWPGA